MKTKRIGSYIYQVLKCLKDDWLIEKTGIQSAQKVRSTKGLLLYIFGRIAAAFIFLVI